MLTFHHRIPRPDAVLGLVVAEGIDVSRVPDGFDAYLDALLRARAGDLPAPLDARRKAIRDLLRNGVYKPTGRAKPATEYLLRTASEGTFPRINGAVDVCNSLCIEHLLPISLWDLDLAQTDTFTFRLGGENEAYVFNSGGQEIGLHDLIVGCRVKDDRETPIVNPVKDSLATKTTPQTTRVAAVVYSSEAAAPLDVLHAEMVQFETLLRGMGERVRAAHGVVFPGQTCTLDPA